LAALYDLMTLIFDILISVTHATRVTGDISSNSELVLELKARTRRTDGQTDKLQHFYGAL